MPLVPAFLILYFLIICPSPIYGYIGPGLGMGVVGVIVGIVCSVFLAIFALAWYPIKRLLSKRTKKKH